MMGIIIAYIALVALLLIIAIGRLVNISNQKRGIEDRAELLRRGRHGIKASRFLEIRNKRFGGQGNKMYLHNFDFIGVYIILNETKNKYYIGHGQNVFNRIGDVLNGRGNMFVYNDFINGDQLIISFRSLDLSSFHSLADLEQDTLNNMSNQYTNYANTKKSNNSKAISPVKPRIDRKQRTTVSQRVNNFKQPKGGYRQLSEFERKQFNDGIDLKDENLHGSTVGLVVDYLTRLLLGEPKEVAFEISLKGASNINMFDFAQSLLSDVKDLSDKSIVSACKLVSFDTYYRRFAITYEKYYDKINPDSSTIYNIKTLVMRAMIILETYGPIIDTGFTIYDHDALFISNGDGDFITQDTIWELKVTKSSPTPKHRLQILVYYEMLKDKEPSRMQNIKYLGILNPRLNIAYRLEISNLDHTLLDEIRKEVIGYN